MGSIRPATRYTITMNSPTGPDPSMSLDSFPSWSDASTPNINLATLARKLGEGKKRGSVNPDDRGLKEFTIPDNSVADVLKKNGEKGSSGLGWLLCKKLFKGAAGENPKKVKANTRTVAMVNKEQDEAEEEITRLKISLMEKNAEVEKLKELCLKQREEIKTLQSAVLFPESMSSQLVPSLQRQVASLKGRLQSLADDVAEAEKYYGRVRFDNHYSSPMTPTYDRDDGAKNLFDQEYRSSHYTTPDSPDKMILRDLYN